MAFDKLNQLAVKSTASKGAASVRASGMKLKSGIKAGVATVSSDAPLENPYQFAGRFYLRSY
jgi:hypothetical protein